MRRRVLFHLQDRLECLLQLYLLSDSAGHVDWMEHLAIVVVLVDCCEVQVELFEIKFLGRALSVLAGFVLFVQVEPLGFCTTALRHLDVSSLYLQFVLEV